MTYAISPLGVLGDGRPAQRRLRRGAGGSARYGASRRSAAHGRTLAAADRDTHTDTDAGAHGRAVPIARIRSHGNPDANADAHSNTNIHHCSHRRGGANPGVHSHTEDNAHANDDR